MKAIKAPNTTNPATTPPAIAPVCVVEADEVPTPASVEEVGDDEGRPVDDSEADVVVAAASWNVYSA
jgi:hypothetical protein